MTQHSAPETHHKQLATSRHLRPKRLLTLLAAAAILPVIAGCGSSAKKEASTNSYAAATSSSNYTRATSTSAASGTGGPKIEVGTVSGLGQVLVNEQGHTLYVFSRDAAKKIMCVSTCATVWPPLKVPAGVAPVAVKGVISGKLGSVADPEGGRVVTYHGWPLYTYVADSAPGTASGQALNLNGGYWYVISPTGKVIH